MVLTGCAKKQKDSGQALTVEQAKCPNSPGIVYD